MTKNHSVSQNRPSGKRTHSAAEKLHRSSDYYLKLLVLAPLAGLLVLFLMLLLSAQILSKTADPDSLSDLFVLVSVFVSGGVCGKIASKTAGKPFPWCILSCLLLSCIGMVLAFAFRFCPDTDRLFKSAVLGISLLGSVCFSVPGRKKERRPKH